MKRVAVFLDGTWNTISNNTNVWRLKSVCEQSPDQVVYYSAGIGTLFGEKYRGGVAGFGIDHEIIDAYAWLVQNCEPDDELFLFGFSRGAYTARSLSGLISKCGMLRPGAPLSLEQLYARYKLGKKPTIREMLEAKNSLDLEETWIVRYCSAMNIKFVGVWDTVGSMGNPLTPLQDRIARYRFLDTHLYHSNLHAFHALALDEQRKPFEPTFWTVTIPNSDTAHASSRTLAEVEQRWFVGAHGNVGGGYPSDVLAQAPLKWLADKAVSSGLRLRFDLSSDPLDPQAPIADSFADFYGYLRLINTRFHRPVGIGPDFGSRFSTSRINETIDGSVFERWRSNDQYRPQNLSEWASRYKTDPARLAGAVMATAPSQAV